jgi:AP endonuclease-1
VEPSNGRAKRSRKTQNLVYTETSEQEEIDEAEVKITLKKNKRTAKDEVGEDVKVKVEPVQAKGVPHTAKAKRVKTTQVAKVEEKIYEEGEVEVKVKRKRKTKEQKEAEAMPLAARSLGSKVLVGAHVSSAGGVHNAIANSVHIGGNAFALFLKSHRKWENPVLQDDHLTSFMSSCKDHKYGHHDHVIPPIVPHGSYLVNLAHHDPVRAKQAYDVFLDDLVRCSKLGIRLYNFHPGNCGASESRAHAISHLASQLNKAHKDTSSGNVITLLETMTSSTNVLGATFEDLAETIAQVDDKERVGVCLDTCHVFTAGYDLRKPEAFHATMDKFDKVVGFKYLKALHMNDSKAPFNSGRDLHANIGTGFLGLRAFHNIMNEPRLWGLPMVLETPIDVKDAETGKEVPDKRIWAREIKLLESLVGMSAETDEFTELEAELHAQGEAERQRIQVQVSKKEAKAKDKENKARAKAGQKGKRKGKKATDPSSDEESSGDRNS